jgi:hypothetical protein
MRKPLLLGIFCMKGKAYFYLLKPLTLKTKTLLLAFCTLLGTHGTKAQAEFFKTDINPGEISFYNFYSSVTVNGPDVYFIGNNYTLYAYDKATGQKKWENYLGWATNLPVYNMGDTLITGFSDSGKNAMSAFINAKTGTVLKQLPFGPIHSKPFFKNGMMYSTALYQAGQVLAYDIKKDTVAWARFVAHGMDTQPVYLKDKILANAEATNWFEIDYNNKLLEKCNQDPGYQEDFPCMKNYWLLSHDGKEISEAFLDKHLGYAYNIDSYCTHKNTFLMSLDKLVILDKKLKVKENIALEPYDNAETGVSTHSEYYKIVHADDNNVWYMSHDVLVKYSLKDKKALKTYILEKWSPHCAVLDGGNLWVISNQDGQLYGLKLD